MQSLLKMIEIANQNHDGEELFGFGQEKNDPKAILCEVWRFTNA